MTRLVTEILQTTLKNTEAWQRAAMDWPELREFKNDKVAETG